MGDTSQNRIKVLPTLLDPIINWAHANSLWPMYFGLSCCFVEEATALTSRYDIARFGSEVLRLSPRQSDLMIIAGTVFKKIAPVVLRLYEQMAEPRWVISMGSCSNTGGMYDVYSVVQGVDQILPVDVYIPGCPPRPEAVLAGLNMLQEKIKKQERPTGKIFHLGYGTQGTTTPVLIDGKTKSRDTRGPGMNGIPIRGSAVSPPDFFDSRSDGMWTPPAQRIELTPNDQDTLLQLKSAFGDHIRSTRTTSDMPTVWVDKDHIRPVLRFLKAEARYRYERLEDYTAIDESARRHPDRHADFTLVYHLLCFEPPQRIRLMVALEGDYPKAPSICDIWPSANWYEREIFDMFGITFPDHPNLRRLIMPSDWQGHPLRKAYPQRATDLTPYTHKTARERQPDGGDTYFAENTGDDTMIINIGPHHTATHGLFRIIAKLEGEIITGLDLDIGYHHRAVEKMGERQTYLQFMPYTDRVDYLAGAANELPYVLAVETIAGIEVPLRAQYIRVLLSELFRLSNHLSFLGIMGHDLGAMTPNFYTFREREYLLDIVELITGGRLHPAFFRLGGVAKDLPEGWQAPLDAFLKRMPKHLNEYATLTLKNPIFKARTRGVGKLNRQQAIDWGVTGPNLRACGLDWDLRKKMPYSAYDQFEFEVPTGTDGDSYTRYALRLEECRQSLRIIEQVRNRMPEGRYVTEDYRYAVPARKDMLKDIESLIHHFINVTRGPKIPRGQAYVACEIPRGEQGYYIVSDGLGCAYRLHIRGPSFTNVQVFPLMAAGGTIADLVAVLGSTDYTLPDMDR